MRQVFLDIETTGPDIASGNRVIEIACVEAIDNVNTGRVFHRRINPERVVEAGAAQVHEMTWESLKHEVVFAEIAAAFVQFIAGAELVMHNAPFRISFLNAELARLHYPPLAKFCILTDTLLLARSLNPGKRSSLDALCERYNVGDLKFADSDALHNAKRLARVYAVMTGQKVSG